MTPPGMMAPASSPNDARAIVIAGNPLSQVPTAITPFRVGRLRTSRRSTSAASLRYASESNIPVVPCDRPSHGSETWAANGSAPSRSSSSAASRTSRPTSQWPVWYPSAIGRPSSARRPPCVERMRNGSRAVFAGSQPIPAFWDRPKASPDGPRRSSGVSGSTPAGPAAVVSTSYRSGCVSCTGPGPGRSRTSARSSPAWRRRSGRSSAGRTRLPPSQRRGSASPRPGRRRRRPRGAGAH